MAKHSCSRYHGHSSPDPASKHGISRKRPAALPPSLHAPRDADAVAAAAARAALKPVGDFGQRCEVTEVAACGRGVGARISQTYALKSQNGQTPPPLPWNGPKWSGAGQKLAVSGMLGCAGLLCSAERYTMWMQQQVRWLVELVIACSTLGR
jgi:hypothetical protein